MPRPNMSIDTRKLGSGLSLSHSAMPRQNVIMIDLTLEVVTLEVLT